MQKVLFCCSLYRKSLHGCLSFSDRVAGEIIRLVASVHVCVCKRVRPFKSVGALLFKPFDRDVDF